VKQPSAVSSQLSVKASGPGLKAMGTTVQRDSARLKKLPGKMPTANCQALWL